MGRKIVLTGTKLTDTDAPVLPNVDRIESAGSLLLLDPTHPAGPWAAGAPATGAEVPNLLSAQAASLTGATASTSGVVITGLTGAQGRVERSGKGGLHVIYSQTNTTNTSTSRSSYLSLAFPTAVRTYLHANPNHEVYVSLWANITRPNAAGKPATWYSSIANLSSPTSNYKLAVQGTMGATALGGVTGSHAENYMSTGVKRNSIAVNTWAGTPAAANENTLAWTIGNGPAINNQAGAREASASAVFYRFYAEDLTVSGRSYSTVDAIDAELFTKEVLTPGGRYYADTFTSPSTIP